VSNASLYRYLAEHCSTHRVRQYLEIGTRDGGSLRVVLENASQHLDGVWVADKWGNDYGGSGRGSHAHIEQLLDDFDFHGLWVPLDGDSRETIPALMPEMAEAFDLVLVDGDHSAEGGLADLDNVWPLVRPGGCVAFHDITHPAHMYLAEVFDGFVLKHAVPHEMILEPYGVGVAWKR
jgi:predicted O-methyltransferase YrrM